MTNDLTLFGSVYDCGAYGGGNFDNNSACSTTTSSSSSSGSPGRLSNTGFDLLLIITIAVTLALIAMVVRIWKRPRKTTTTDRPGPT